jgi:transcriptional regulator with XRE-family HTH domain
VSAPFRTSFAVVCRDTRTMLDISQREVAETVGVSRAHIAAIESGRANPTLDLVTRIASALGLEIEIVSQRRVVGSEPRQRDAMHARCSGYVSRRLRAAGCECRREVVVEGSQAVGWIDILAFEPRTHTLIIIEIKTRITDIGEIERQVGWYERVAGTVAARYGWRPRHVVTWLLVLASDEVEAAIKANRDVLHDAFPARSDEIMAVVEGRGADVAPRRAMALVDPASRRRQWLFKSRSDGRRSPAPYRDYADAARRAGAGHRRSGTSA